MSTFENTHQQFQRLVAAEKVRQFVKIANETREMRGITPTKFGQAIFGAGSGRTIWGRVVNGERELRHGELYIIALYLGVSAEEMLTLAKIRAEKMIPLYPEEGGIDQ